MIKYVLFDLDGTLLSTLDTIAYHLNSTLSGCGLNAITVDDIRRFIGNGAKKLVASAVMMSGVNDEEVISQVLSIYNRAYHSDPIPATEPYDGITRLVDTLYNSGVKLAVVTNKPDDTAKKLIEHFFPGRFDLISGGRAGIVLKPDPNEALSVLSRLGGNLVECAFVGDTSVDIVTGKNMGAALSVGVSWGFRSRDELFSAGADRIADTADELLDILCNK